MNYHSTEYLENQIKAKNAEIASLRAELTDARAYGERLLAGAHDAGQKYDRVAKEMREENDSIRAELAANNELYAIAQSDLAAVSLQYDAATAVIERLEAAARHDAEEKARLREGIALALKEINEHNSTDNCHYHTDDPTLERIRAALPQGEVSVQAHGPFPGAPFSPLKEDR